VFIPAISPIGKSCRGDLQRIPQPVMTYRALKQPAHRDRRIKQNFTPRIMAPAPPRRRHRTRELMRALARARDCSLMNGPEIRARASPPLFRAMDAMTAQGPTRAGR